MFYSMPPCHPFSSMPNLDPTQQDIERGARFAAWLSAAMRAKGWNMKNLADASGVTPTNIGIYIKDGIDPQTGIVRRVRPATVRKLAVALEADESAGLIAAGYTGLSESERVIIAPGRAVRVLTSGSESVDMVLTQDAIDLVLAYDAVRKSRSKSN